MSTSEELRVRSLSQVGPHTGSAVLGQSSPYTGSRVLGQSSPHTGSAVLGQVSPYTGSGVLGQVGLHTGLDQGMLLLYRSCWLTLSAYNFLIFNLIFKTWVFILILFSFTIFISWPHFSKLNFTFVQGVPLSWLILLSTVNLWPLGKQQMQVCTHYRLLIFT